MKKLFTFLSRANNNSVGNSFNQPRVSFIYSMLTLVAIILMVPQGAKARQFVYDFRSLAKAAYEQSGYSNKGFYDINMGGAYSGVSGLVANYGASTTYGNVTVDFSKFAFRMNISELKGWLLYTTDYNANLAGLTYRGTEPRFVITNLRPDDEITIYCKAAASSNRTANITFLSGNAKWSDGNQINDNTTLINHSGDTNEQHVTFKASENGDIVLTTTAAAWHTILTGVVINRPDRASYNYDPAIENYDLSSLNNGSASASSTEADYQLGNQDAYYLSNPTGYSLSKRIAVQSNVSNLSWNNGLKNTENDYWGFKYISISNLKADDRVRITFEGGAIFASAPDNVFNSSVFLDVDNDGLQDSQEDVTITAATNVQSGSWYTMLEDGHLDFILMGGATIKKIEIYCDHQARMVDRYGSNATEGNASYFDTTGQLMTKHHIVPGGLHVYIGGDAATEHAEVVYSDEGPVSYVYDYAHYKPARHATWGSFTYSSALPVTGTYYRFIPDVDGQITVRFKTYSVNYTDWGSDGKTEGYERQVTTQCPYYLALKNGSVPSSPLQSTTKGSGETVTFTYHLTTGNEYYLYGWWPDGTNGDNFGQRGCGIAELIDVTFAADKYVYPLAKWVESGTTEDADLATVTGYYDVHVKKKSDNIKSCHARIKKGKLSIDNIVFNDPAKGGGTILLKIGNPNIDADPVFAYTIAYNAAYNPQTIGKDANGNDVTRSEGHTWNFSDQSLNGLRWTNKNAEADVTPFGTRFNGFFTAEKDENGVPNNGVTSSTFGQSNYSLLSEETENGDWTFNYRVKKNGQFHDPRFLNNWDMVGDNADMIWDTEGLIFNTPSSISCIFNEYGSAADHTSATDPDRYVGILPGGSFTIPALQAGDRVVIRMGSGDGSSNDACKLNITGALDAIGQTISSTDIYNGGGSQWDYSGGTYDYRGAYQFISTGGDMTFTMNGGSMTKLYTITIYRGAKSATTDATRVKDTYNGIAYNADAWWLYNDYRTETGQEKRAAYALHFRGKGQRQKTPVVLYKSGNINTDGDHLMYGETGNSKAPRIFFKSEKEQYGMFRMRIEDYELNNKYVADYGLQNVAVGYLQNKTYPYTWDFTDLMGYVNTSTRIQKERTNVNNYAPKTVTGNYDIEFMNYTVGDGVKSIEQWKSYAADGDIPAGYGLHVRNEPYNGGVMWESGQLYAGDEIFAESFGLSISAPGVSEAYNGGLRITEDGLCLTGGNWKITIPEVGTSNAVYVRATPIGDVTAGVGDAETSFTYVGTATDNSGDKIYAVNGTGADMTLFFNNVIIKKIAISNDPKSVNHLGYATESRIYEIDPELMGYMTGTGLKAYTVTKVTYGDKAGDIPSITLTEIPKANVMGEAGTGDHRGYIIYNTDAAVDAPEGTAADAMDANGQTKAVSILGGGFHLFVPDMHDKSTASGAKKSLLETENGKNHLRSHTNSGNIPQTEDIENKNYTNYLMNWRYKDGRGNEQKGPEAFYRASSGARLSNNKAYLQLLTEKVKPENYSGANAKQVFAIVFVDEVKGIATTVLDGVKTTEMYSGDDAIYTLSGMKVNNPQKGVIYIKNGKKFIVK